MTHRLRPHQIAGSELASAPADGDVMTWYATDDEARWAAPAGGGSGRSLDRRWNVGSTETSYHEFTSGGVPGSGVRVDSTGGAARVTWAVADDNLTATNTGGDTTAHLNALMFPLSGLGGSLSTGDAFITCLGIGAPQTDYSFGGLLFSDGTTHGAGNQVVATSHWGSSSRDHFLRSYTNFTTVGTSVAGAAMAPLFNLAFVRAVYLGGTTWRRDLSPDGRSWIKGSANLTKSLTATHVGFLSSSWGTSTVGVISYEFLRRVAGVT